MKLKNPPVIQSWIGFQFSPGPAKPKWELKTADAFADLYKETLPECEAIIETKFQIQHVTGKPQRPKITPEDSLDKLRARNADQTRWLQLADDHMVYNQMRGDSYPGFESLRDEALLKLADYVDFFKPASLRAVELHYVDVIEIPAPADQRIQIQDYFKLRMEVPEQFGLTWYFSTQALIRPPEGESGVLHVRFQALKPTPEKFPFRLDWHYVCLNFPTWEREVVCRRLDQAHTCLVDYFRAAVTDKTWQLFEPSDEE